LTPPLSRDDESRPEYPPVFPRSPVKEKLSICPILGLSELPPDAMLAVEHQSRWHGRVARGDAGLIDARHATDDASAQAPAAPVAPRRLRARLCPRRLSAAAPQGPGQGVPGQLRVAHRRADADGRR